MDATLGRIVASTNRETLAPAAFVIEAAIEDLAVKQEIFAALDRMCGPETILASNTSSLSITALGGATERPGAGGRDALLQPGPGDGAGRGDRRAAHQPRRRSTRDD